MTRIIDTTRRRLIGTSLAAGALASWSRLSFAGNASRAVDAGANRLVFVILRGGMDGLYAAPAIGDPAFADARGSLGLYPTPPLALDNTFALHPILAQLHAMYGRGELAVVHAVGLPYRDRSHFDAQQVLESGGTRPYELTTGWLGRALAGGNTKGLALSTAVPLVLRGRAAVDTWAPSYLPDPTADLVARIERMYGNDAALATALGRAKALHFDPVTMADAAAASSADGTSMSSGAMNGGPAKGASMNKPINKPNAGAAAGGAFVQLAQRAAEFLAQPDGPQAAVLEVNGWDTHANQAAPNGPLATYFRQLDAGLVALRDGIVTSGTWARTAIVVASEFGREVAINGTLGTDHGTGGVAFVLGGAVQGGRVLTDWPGLAKKDRYEGRDLRTTTDLRGVLKGLLADQLQVTGRTLDAVVFPGSEGVKGLRLIRS
ncbi:DUF1501 domain-containing protein [soil metagenome]